VTHAAGSALERIQIGQSAKSRRSANEVHRPTAAKAQRWSRRLRGGIAGAFFPHDTAVREASAKTRGAADMRCQHYRDVAEALIFSNLTGSKPERLAAPNIGSGAPKPAMPLQGTVAPAFTANQRHRLPRGRLPLTDRRVISRVPPSLCNAHLTRTFDGVPSAIGTDARRRTGRRMRNERNCTKNPDQ
jgi:hypothetical protein